jgi:hypothetical protein
LKKFEELYERRHPIAKGILLVLPIILFLYSFGLVFLSIAEAGTDFVELGLVPFTITGYVILFIVVSIHKKLNKNVLGGLGALLFFPFLFWGICQIWIIDVTFRYWQISLL